MIKNSYTIEERGRKKEMCGENSMSSLIWKCYAGMQHWWWFNMIQSCSITSILNYPTRMHVYIKEQYLHIIIQLVTYIEQIITNAMNSNSQLCTVLYTVNVWYIESL
jgi:hypothetical protein